MTTITNTSAFIRRTTVSTSADRMTAYQVREFVKAIDEASVPDGEMVTARRASDTMHFVGLSVAFDEQIEMCEHGLATGRCAICNTHEGT